jgi:hypothetical protein
VMDRIELPLVFATVGLVGLSGLAVLMGAAFCSLAELLALLPARGVSHGREAKRHGRPLLRTRARAAPFARAMVAAVVCEDGADPFTRIRVAGRYDMDLNEFVMQQVIESRLAEARARGDRARLLRSLTHAPTGLRVAAGRALIEAGRWLAGIRSDGGQVSAPALEGRRV